MLAAVAGGEGWEVWGTRGSNCLLEISGCCLQESGQGQVSCNSDDLFISTLDVDKCEEWRKENNIFGKKPKIEKSFRCEKALDVNTYRTITEIMFEMSLIT